MSAMVSPLPPKPSFLSNKIFWPFIGIILIFAIAKIIWPLYLQAQTSPLGQINTTTATTNDDAGVNGNAVGPEFAQFDLRAQDKVYTNVIQPHDTQIATQIINELGNAYNPNPTAPAGRVVLRVAGVTSISTVQNVLDYAASLNAYNGFPNGTIVVFGNELNNLDLEWKNKGDSLDAAAIKYAELFNAFGAALDHSRYRLAPAPPDMYNGVYDPAPWVKAFAGKVDCSKVDTLVANVFDVTPRIGGGNLDTYKYLESNICGKKVTHFGGWGMDPNNSPAIQAQVDWLKTHKLPDGVATATTLIIDTCGGKNSNVTKSDWLYYVNGKVYDIDGNLIDQATCDKAKSVYFEYNIQRANTDTVIKNFVDEYSVACMPKADYQLNQGNIGSCKGSSLICPGLRQPWNISGDLKVSSNEKLFGLFRDENATTQRYRTNQVAENRLESLESYLGVQDYSNQDFSTNPALSEDRSTFQAPLYKLSTEAEICTYVKNKLQAVVELCSASNQIEGVDTKTLACALDTPIPNTQHETNSTLWSKVKDLDCDTFMNSANTDEQKELKQKILNTPITLENAYRPAFVVAVTKFDARDPNQNVTVDTDASADKPNGTFTVVDYMEVKIPAFGSDFIDPDLPRANPEKNNAARNSYRDPLRITADILTPLADQERWKEDAERRRTALQSAMTVVGQSNEPSVNRIIGGPGNPVLCYKNGALTKCTPEANSTTDLESGQIKDTLPNALFSFINMSGAVNPTLPCDNDADKFYDAVNVNKVAEQARQIGVFLTPVSKMGDFTKKLDAKTHLDVNVKDVTQGDVNIKTHTSLYFVSPQGENFVYARNGFYNFLTLNDQQKLDDLGVLVTTPAGLKVLDQDQFPKAIKSESVGEITGSEEERTGYNFLTAAQPAPLPGLTGLGTPTPQFNTFTYGLSVGAVEENGKAKPQNIFWQVAGQVASLPTRLMALVTSPINSALNNYTQSCARDPNDPNKPNPYATEDWLLGKCKGGSQTTASPTPTNDYLSQEVVSTSDCRSFARIGGGPADVTDPTRLGLSCPGNNLPGIKYIPELDIASWKNGSDAVACSESFYKYVVCTNGPGSTADGLGRQGSAPALIAHKVDAQGNFTPSGVMTACEYVVKQAQQRGISPKLALAMWGEESGFSAFTTTTDGEDFGVISAASSRAISSISKQVDGFLNTISGYTNYLTFLLNYSGEKDKSGTPPVYFCNNRQFPDRLKTFYNYMR